MSAVEPEPRCPTCGVPLSEPPRSDDCPIPEDHAPIDGEAESEQQHRSPSALFRIRSVQPFVGKQIILWLEDGFSGAHGPSDDLEWCVRLTIDEARSVLPQIMDAYAVCMQELAMELAMGGCRACRNQRVVNGHPCEVCVPRGERRIRAAARLQPRAHA